MTTQKYDNVWANSGNIGTEPTTAKQDTGLVRREKPVRQLLNRLFNEAQTKINSLIADNSSTNDQSTSAVSEYSISTGLFSEPWGYGADSNNIIDTGSGKTIVQTCIYFDSGEPRLLLLDSTANEILVYDARTRELITSSGDLTATIGGTAPSVHAMCCDDEAAYVLFEDAVAHRVGRFLLTTLTYDSAWPTGGQVLSSGTIGDARIKMVNSTCVAISQPWVSIASSGSYAIRILLAADGTSYGRGAGDANIAASQFATGHFASDGTNIFFGTIGGGTDYVCSMPIATPTSGTGGTGFPRAGDGVTRSICSAGSEIVAINSGVSPSDDEIIIWHLNADNSDIDGVKTGTPDSGEPATYSYAYNVEGAVFDGMTFWVKSVIYTASMFTGGVTRSCVFGVDANVLGDITRSDAFYPDLTSVIRGPYIVPVGASSTTYDCITYDGRDLWTTDSTQYIHRLPLASRR